LRARDFDPDQAVALLRTFLQFRKYYHWQTHVRTSDDGILRALYSQAHWILPRKDIYGRTVIVMHPARFDTSIASMDVFLRMGAFIMQWATGLTRSCPEGEGRDLYCTFIVDFSGVTMRTVTAFGPSTVAKGVQLWQNCYPVKLRGIYLLNTGRVMSGAVACAKSLMAPKLRDRIETFSQAITSGPGSQQDLIGRLGGDLAYIPTEWGGELDYTGGSWSQKLDDIMERAEEDARSDNPSHEDAGSDKSGDQWWQDWTAERPSSQDAAEWA